jgi:hypothetical protein
MANNLRSKAIGDPRDVSRHVQRLGFSTPIVGPALRHAGADRDRKKQVVQG